MHYLVLYVNYNRCIYKRECTRIGGETARQSTVYRLTNIPRISNCAGISTALLRMFFSLSLFLYMIMHRQHTRRWAGRPVHRLGRYETKILPTVRNCVETIDFCKPWVNTTDLHETFNIFESDDIRLKGKTVPVKKTAQSFCYSLWLSRICLDPWITLGLRKISTFTFMVSIIRASFWALHVHL